MASTNRLINQFKPDLYSLNLNLNKKNKNFAGKLTIVGSRRSRPSYRITLNQYGLKVKQAKIYCIQKNKSLEEVEVVRIVHHQKLQEVRLHTKNQILSGKYQIELEYSGKISTKGTNGIYTSNWLDKDSNNHQIITTQFQPHYARQLLPCIDEPEAKAVFNLSLALEDCSSHDIVLFNTPIKSEVTENNVKKISFEPTPNMSSYLIALVIGELGYKSNQINDTEVRVYTTPDKIESTQFALEFACQSIDFLEKKFKIKYPLNKLDLVAVPDFDAGGMENWGLITFREDLLLYSEQNSTLADKQTIALIVAHEVAHQWFGNLVTMKWWDELWLNEGFANFIEYYLVDKIYPEWRMLEQYLITEKTYAIRLDSLPSSRPIINKVKTPYQVVDSFDAIAYEKSGSVIRMIFNLLGEDDFMSGLSDYFKKYSYKSATSSDLLECWQKYTKFDLKKLTKTWLNEPGIPKLELTIGNNPKQIKIKQSRFLSEPKPKINLDKTQKELLKNKPNIKSKQKEFYLNQIKNKLYKQEVKTDSIWHIPISFVNLNENKTDNLVIKKPQHIIQFDKKSQLPIKLNQNGESLYVTSYPIEFLAPISKELQKGSLADADVLNIFSDLILLNRSRQFDPGAGAILDLIQSAKDSAKQAQFWSITGGFIGYLHYHLKQIDQTKLLKNYTNDLIQDKLNQVGYDSAKTENPNDIATRFELLSLASLVQNKQLSTKLYELFINSQGNLTNIEPEKRLLVLYTVAKKGKKTDYNLILKNYKEKISDPTIRDDLTYGLCMFEAEDHIKHNLQIMQDSDLVKEQDILSWLSQLIGCNKTGTKNVLDWILKNGGWEWLSANLSPFDKSNAVRCIISSSFSNKDLNLLVKFFKNLEDQEIKKALDESLEIANSRIAWHKKELPKAIEYLTNYSGSKTI